MKKNLTEIVFILDRSGSMSGLESDTIGGFNSMIEKQKREGGEALISTVLFDNFSEVIHDRVDIQKITPMTDREYTVRGCTALLDAVRPRAVVCCASSDRRYNSAHPDALALVRSAGAELYFSDRPQVPGFTDGVPPHGAVRFSMGNGTICAEYL